MLQNTATSNAPTALSIGAGQPRSSGHHRSVEQRRSAGRRRSPSRPPVENRRFIGLTLGWMLLAALGCEANSGADTFSCDELKPEVSALEANFSGDAARGKVAAFVQASKDMSWASTTLEQEVASACLRIGTDVGMAPADMPPDEGTGGTAAGICNAVNKHLDLIQRSQGLRAWITIAAPECQPNQNAWTRCSSVCDVARDPQCNLLCRIHADVHATCDEAQVRVRPARDETLPPQLMSTLQNNLVSLVQAQVTIGQRLSQGALALNQLASVLPDQLKSSSSSTRDCIGAGHAASKDAMLRMRVSERAASDLIARVQGY